MKQVLVVDDHADLRRLVRWSLEMLEIPFTLHEASNGDAGLRMAMVVAPDLMLLDVMMPGDLNGLDVCRRVRQDPRLAATRIVLLSARGQSTDIQAGLDAGADAYIVKPFRPLQLVESVEKLLSSPAPSGTASADAGRQAAATRQTTSPTSSATSRERRSGPTATPTGRP